MTGKLTPPTFLDLPKRLRAYASDWRNRAIDASICEEAATYIESLEKFRDHYKTASEKPVADVVAFNRWLAEGPKLAKAAGLYVGIKVMDENDPEAVKSRPALAKAEQGP